MYDLYHFIGGDISKSPTGDLRPVTGSERGTQRILRRLMTNPDEYIFHPEYGAGLGRKIGQTVNKNEWEALIRGQMLLEDCVAQTPTPQITLTLINEGVSVFIQYTDAVSGIPETLSFDVTR